MRAAGALALALTATVTPAAAQGAPAPPAALPAALSGAAPVTVPPAPAYGTRMDMQVSRGGLAGVPVTARYAAVLTGVSPATGPLAGGTSVRVVGRGLAGSSDWRVGGQSATCTVAGDTAATCVVPPGLAAGPVPVTFTPAGGAPYLATAKATYTYR